MTYEINQINNFDGVRWYGVFVNERLVWTGTKDSCESYGELLELRASPDDSRMHRRNRAAVMRERAAGRYDWASNGLHDAPTYVPKTSVSGGRRMHCANKGAV